MTAYPPDWRALMAAERASLAHRANDERGDLMAAEHHAATDRSGLPQPPRHRGVMLPDGAPERWEVAE